MTTWTVMPSGGDYSSLNAALSNILTVPGDIIEISGDWTAAYDTTAATVLDDNITIRTKVGDVSRHPGYDNGGANYKLTVSSGAHSLTVNNTGCVIENIILEQAGTGGSDEGIRCNFPTGGVIRVVNSILRGVGAISQQDGIFIGNSENRNIELENCLLHGWGRGGIYIQNNGGAATCTAKAISCTFWNNGRFSTAFGGGAVVLYASNAASISNFDGQNCWAIDNVSGDPTFEDYCIRSGGSGTTNWQLDNCVSGDDSLNLRDSGAVNGTINASVTDGTPSGGSTVGVENITTAPFDLRLKSHANNFAQDQHANATGSGLTIGDFTGSAIDVVGTSRPQNTNYDIGFFEIEAAAPAGRIMSSLVNSGGLAGPGGIAGPGGGLAG